MKNKQTTLLFITLINVFTFQIFAQKSNYSEIIAQNADKIEQKVIAWRHDIHQHPELGNREFRTAELVAKHLKSLGIDVKTKVGVTGVVGQTGGSFPKGWQNTRSLVGPVALLPCTAC